MFEDYYDKVVSPLTGDSEKSYIPGRVATIKSQIEQLNSDILKGIGEGRDVTVLGLKQTALYSEWRQLEMVYQCRSI